MMKVHNIEVVFKFIWFVVLGVLLGMCIATNMDFGKKKDEPKVLDEDLRYYTYTSTTPRFTTSSVKDEVRVPLLAFMSGKTDTVYVGKDSVDAIVKDSGEVRIPISQKIYSDSNYTAYVSGFNQSLDSIKLRIPVIIKTIESRRKISFGIIGGLGYGVCSQKIEPFLGLGVSYKLY